MIWKFGMGIKPRLAVVIVILFLATVGNSAPAPAPSLLFANHRTMLALAEARGQKEVVLVMAAHPGKNVELVGEIKSLGGRVSFRDDDLDYVRAIVPLRSVEKLAGSPGLEALDIDIHAMDFFPPDQFPLPKEEKPSEPRDPDTPYSHPYIASRDMDTTTFWAEHPTYDGRGAGLAILDATPDILHAEFSSATSLQGEPIRKIPEILSVTDPVDDTDPMWVKMEARVQAANKVFTYKDETYTAPAAGSFRLGFFNERALEEPMYLYKDVNFDGNPEGSSGLFAVLWDEKSGTVWVDTNQNHDFTDEKPMQEYSRRFDVGTFGRGTAIDSPRKSIAFVVQPDSANKYVRVTLCVWQHVTAVAGAAVGKGFYGGTYNGVAPEARLVPIYYPGGINRITEAAIAAAKSDKVDVICLEPNILDPTMNPLHDGRAVPAIIFDRIIEKSKKPILSPANNTPGVSTVLDYLNSGRVIAVGAYQSADSYRINNGAELTKKDNLHLVGSYGPAGDGGLKPDVISPSEIISVDSGFKPAERRKGFYELPPGYTIAGGTSTAGPTASAAMTLLVSAAKQAGIKYDADRLRLALLAGARFIPDIPAYKQGNGVVQVGASWEILKQLDKKYEPLAIVSRAPVQTANSQLLQTPNQGRGIFEREGWTPGKSGERTITFTRTAGPPEPIAFNLNWVGNDGTFSSSNSITLPLNQPVSLPVKITAASSGVHSAILNLLRPGYAGFSYQTLNTIIAADEFTPSNDYTLVQKGDLERPAMLSFFVHVPANTPALSLDVTIPKGKSTVRVYAFDPSRSARLQFNNAGGTENGHMDKILPNPEPGVWEVLMFGNNFVFNPTEVDSKPLAAIPVTLKTSLISVEMSPLELQLPQHDDSGHEIIFTNTLAPFHGGAFTMPLAAMHRLNTVLASGQRQVYDVKVPAGTQMLRAAVEGPADTSADLSLYLFHEIAGSFYLQKFDDQAGASKVLIVEDPKEGQWKVVVAATHAPANGVPFTYEDSVAHPLFGEIRVDDLPALRANGATWKAKAKVTVSALPTADRVLVGYVPVAAFAEDNVAGNDGTKVPKDSVVGIGSVKIVTH